MKALVYSSTKQHYYESVTLSVQSFFRNFASKYDFWNWNIDVVWPRQTQMSCISPPCWMKKFARKNRRKTIYQKHWSCVFSTERVRTFCCIHNKNTLIGRYKQTVIAKETRWNNYYTHWLFSVIKRAMHLNSYRKITSHIIITPQIICHYF